MSRERDHARSGCSPFLIDWAAAPYVLVGNVRHRVFVIVDSPCTVATRRSSFGVGTLPLIPQQKFPLTLELAGPATILGVRHELNFFVDAKILFRRLPGI